MWARMARILHIQSMEFLPVFIFLCELWWLWVDDCRTLRLRDELCDDALAFDFEF